MFVLSLSIYGCPLAKKRKTVDKQLLEPPAKRTPFFVSCLTKEDEEEPRPAGTYTRNQTQDMEAKQGGKEQGEAEEEDEEEEDNEVEEFSEANEEQGEEEEEEEEEEVDKKDSRQGRERVEEEDDGDDEEEDEEEQIHYQSEFTSDFC